jgi:hypothetical protein
MQAPPAGWISRSAKLDISCGYLADGFSPNLRPFRLAACRAEFAGSDVRLVARSAARRWQLATPTGLVLAALAADKRRGAHSSSSCGADIELSPLQAATKRPPKQPTHLHQTRETNQPVVSTRNPLLAFSARPPRLTVTSSCPMNLQYFPMDRQRCTIEAESCKYTTSSGLAILLARAPAPNSRTRPSARQIDDGADVAGLRAGRSPAARSRRDRVCSGVCRAEGRPANMSMMDGDSESA